MGHAPEDIAFLGLFIKTVTLLVMQIDSAPYMRTPETNPKRKVAVYNILHFSLADDFLEF